MYNSDNSEESTDALQDKRDKQTSKILKSMECFMGDHKLIVTKSSPEFNFRKSKRSPESEEDNQLTSTSRSEEENTELEADNEYLRFLKHMSARYSNYRLKSGDDRGKEGQTMDFSNCCCAECECPSCDRPSCSWQATGGMNGQDCTSGAQMDSQAYMENEVPEIGQYYSYGKPLPSTQSGSDETLVNGPRVPTSDTLDNSANSYNVCCPLRRPGQLPATYSCHEGYPSQEQLMHMSMPLNMEVDPSTGFAYFPCPGPVHYPGMDMSSMPGMQIDQRGRGGQQNEEASSSSCSGSSATSSTVEGGTNNQNSSGFNMEEFMQKYQKSVQQCYATAQKGLQQTFSQVANGQPFFNPTSQGNYYPNSTPGSQQMFASANQAPQYYDPNQEAYQGMQSFSSSLDPQFFGSSSLGAQQYLPPPMAMPSPNIFGNNTNFISDTLHTQTVYSSDYKTFSNEGNHFNHFPNGIDIGLGPDACPGYGPVGSPGMAEMGTGGQAYGLGGAGGMNMSSYPLNHMSYPSPYSYDMPTAPHGHPGLGMANGGNIL